MDEKDQNQNSEGFKPAEQQAPVSNVDGFVTNPRPDTSGSVGTPAAAGSTFNPTSETPATDQEQAAPAPNHEAEVVKLKEQKKGMAVWLVVLLVILFAGAAAAAVYFYQSNQAQKELDAAKAQTAQAQQELATQTQTATQQTIDDLKAQNATLTTENTNLKAENDKLKAENEALKKQVSDLTTYANTMNKLATQLKTTCGAACSAVTIPPVPTSSTTTKTN